ncbi:YtzI protein [Aquibacillus salsiterrae]|uniref:YtzI protein n=1 Tax=Aquibacillus salsiterrae TaxID=2950439 RepID=A0A9X4AER5_9BACI|nr:YtzI protein [Aquibacillus salsiterrae]MDC3417101.1 YtzI protein [Aquibacillus salsiterrae]
MMFIVVIIVCVAVTLLVLGLSIMTINKGYAYKQTIDPLPDKAEEGDKEKANDNR